MSRNHYPPDGNMAYPYMIYSMISTRVFQTQQYNKYF